MEDNKYDEFGNYIGDVNVDWSDEEEEEEDVIEENKDESWKQDLNKLKNQTYEEIDKDEEE